VSGARKILPKRGTIELRLEALNALVPAVDRAKAASSVQDETTLRLSALEWGKLAYILLPSMARPDAESDFLSILNTRPALRSAHNKIMAVLPESVKQPITEQLAKLTQRHQT
jgi:hypothetical protein